MRELARRRGLSRRSPWRRGRCLHSPGDGAEPDETRHDGPSSAYTVEELRTCRGTSDSRVEEHTHAMRVIRLREPDGHAVAAAARMVAAVSARRDGVVADGPAGDSRSAPPASAPLDSAHRRDAPGRNPPPSPDRDSTAGGDVQYGGYGLSQLDRAAFRRSKSGPWGLHGGARAIRPSRARWSGPWPGSRRARRTRGKRVGPDNQRRCVAFFQAGHCSSRRRRLGTRLYAS